MSEKPKRHPSQFLRLRSPQIIRRIIPIHIESELPAVFKREPHLYKESPTAGVYFVKNGFTSNVGVCRDNLGRLIPWDSVSKQGRQRSPVAWDPRIWLRCSSKYNASIGVLCHPSQRGYFHWLFDVLPRYALLEQSAEKIDYLYLDQSLAFQRESWNILKKSGETIAIDDIPFLSARMLLIPTVPSVSGVIPLWVCDWLREKIGRSVEREGKALKIYISRSIKERGSVSNEDSVQSFLKSRGFMVVQNEHLSFQQQVALFKQATMVIGAHGAGLSNIVFASKNCKVVEIFANEYINVCYWTLCSQLDIQYSFMLSESVTGLIGWRPNMFVDISKLKKLLNILETETDN